MNKIEIGSIRVAVFFLYLFCAVCAFGMEQDPDEQKKNEEQLKLDEKRKKLKHAKSSPSMNGDPFKYVADNNLEKLRGFMKIDPSLRKFDKEGEAVSLLQAAIINIKKREKKDEKQKMISKAILGLMLDPKNSQNLNEEILNQSLDYAQSHNMNDVLYALKTTISFAQMKETAEKNVKKLKSDPQSFNEYQRLIFSKTEADEPEQTARRSRASSIVGTETNEDEISVTQFLREGPPVTQQKTPKKSGFLAQIKKKINPEEKSIFLSKKEHLEKIFDRLKFPFPDRNKKNLDMITKQLERQTLNPSTKNENPPPPANSVKSSSSFSNSNPLLTIGVSHSADESQKSSSFEKYYGKPGNKKFDSNNNNNNQ